MTLRKKRNLIKFLIAIFYLLLIGYSQCSFAALSIRMYDNTLAICGDIINQEDSQKIASFLQENKQKISELYIRVNSINTEILSTILGAACYNPDLKRLDLTRCKIGDEGAEVVASLIFDCFMIDELYLGEDNISDEGAKILAKVLLGNQILVKLDLHGNKIGHDGALAIADALKTNQKLLNLWLDQNNFSLNGNLDVMQALQYNTTLLYFTVNCGCDFTANRIFLTRNEWITRLKGLIKTRWPDLRCEYKLIMYGTSKQLKSFTGDELLLIDQARELQNKLIGTLLLHTELTEPISVSLF